MVCGFCFLGVAVVVCAAAFPPAAAQQQPSIPVLPSFFSGYAESITKIQDSGGSSFISSNTTRSFYDTTTNFARLDTVGDGSTEGTVSLVQDTTLGVVYAIYRRYSNCTVSRLTSAPDLYLGDDNRYHLRSLNDLFLLSAVQYNYSGNMSAHGIILDNWEFSGAFSHGGYNYTNSKLLWSITQPGQLIASTSAVTSSPLPWRLSIDALVTPTSSNESSTTNVSVVTRYFDLSFEEPSFDVFDVSVCASPSEAVYLTLAVPIAAEGGSGDVNQSQFRGNIRMAVSNYTQVYPTQVGNIEISSNNGTFLFVSLQISNLTSKANVTGVGRTALEALALITNNTTDGLAPFQVELSSGNLVTPYVVLPNKTENCPTSSSSSASMSPGSSMTTSVTPIVTVTTTITETVTGSCSAVPPTQSTTTTTPTPTCSPTAPPQAGVSQGQVVGIAFGTLITGSFVSCVCMVVCFLCYQKTSRTKMWSPSTAGYQKQPDTVADKDYFQ